MAKSSWLLVSYLLTSCLRFSLGWLVAPTLRHRSQVNCKRRNRVLSALSSEGEGGTPVDLSWLKGELLEYVEKRKAAESDNSKSTLEKKVLGGTKGNVILDFVSAAPTKEKVVDASAQMFDYDELAKYGYSKLATPIMEAGGRRAMYELLGLPQPPPPSIGKPKVLSAPKLVIDRTGENDKARYTGLKLGQVLDDDMQAVALQNAQEKIKAGESLRQKLEEESFERPFADKRNVGPAMVPDWTPERLDEWGRQQGKAVAWARRARQGEFVGDPLETLDIELPQRIYSLCTGLLVALGFGKSTATVLENFGEDTVSIQDTLQVPAAALLLSAFGSAMFCSFLASGKNRNGLLWFVKGLLGGPLTISQLRSVSSLQTRAEQRENS